MAATLCQLALVILAIVACVSSKETNCKTEGWSYWPEDSMGPKSWHKQYKTCQGNRQSPIDIKTASAHYSKDLTPFNFVLSTASGKKKKKPGIMIATNDGNNAQITLTSSQPSVEGGGLKDTYTVSQLAFHWGVDSSAGSEHTVDGKKYPMEMQIFCVRASEKIDAARQKQSGVISMAVLFEIGSEKNKKCEQALQRIRKTKYKGDKTKFKAFPLTDLLPTNTDKFWKYDGSIAFPPCLETTTWFVFQDTIKISEKQLAMLRKLSRDTRKNSKSQPKGVFAPLSGNSRPVQDLSGRTVYTTQKPSSGSWTYSHGSLGPEKWYTKYPTCKGDRQSPIDIVTSGVKYGKELTAFEFVNYDKADGMSMTIYNNGHTAKVAWAGLQPSIRGGGLPEDYNALQLHFHWGANSSLGSEHTVDGKMYPLEMHIVHMRASEKDLATAVQKRGALAVLGVMFEISKKGNMKFDQVFNSLGAIIEKGSTESFSAFPLQELLPSSTRAFWRYEGGLTTPPCSESVIWTVFEESVKISEDQLDKLRQLKEGHAEMKIIDNFRPVQNLAGRVVLTSNQ